MEWILENWQAVAAIVGQVVLAASAIAALTPTPADDKFIGKVYKFLIDIPALNIGKAKDK